MACAFTPVKCVHAVITLIAILSICASVALGAGRLQRTGDLVTLWSGFLTGDAFLKLSEVQKQSYAMGLIDGMLLAPAFGAPEAESEWLGRCIKGMSAEQVAAIIVKQTKDNPGQWHQPLHGPAFSAMKEACGVAR